GTTVQKWLPADQLARPVAGTKSFADFAQRNTAQVYDRLVRFAAETNGNVDEAFKQILPGAKAPSPELATKVRKLGDDVQRINKLVHGDIQDKGGNVRWIMARETTDGLSAGFEQLPRYVDTATKKE